MTVPFDNANYVAFDDANHVPFVASARPTIYCPKHGVHEHIITSTVLGHEGHWCLLCWLETLGPSLSHQAGEVAELTPKEVEAQNAFTQMRDEILSLSDGLEVNEVLCVIDNYTPEWV